jgi:hypothetical protein
MGSFGIGMENPRGKDLFIIPVQIKLQRANFISRVFDFPGKGDTVAHGSGSEGKLISKRIRSALGWITLHSTIVLHNVRRKASHVKETCAPRFAAARRSVLIARGHVNFSFPLGAA